MIIKKTNSRELALTAEGNRVELVERHFGKYTDRATYGITLEAGAGGSVLTLWREEEGGRRSVIRTIYLTDGEAERLRNDVMRVKNFTGFSTLFFYLMFLRDKLSASRGGSVGHGAEDRDALRNAGGEGGGDAEGDGGEMRLHKPF